MRHKVKGEPGLVRDSFSRAILFTNTEEMVAYEAKKRQMESQNSEINTLKHEVAELKEIIRQLIERQENR